MNRTSRDLVVATVTMGAVIATPVAVAQAKDDPTPQERAAIESTLRQMGFTSWHDIEREDDGGVWEFDDARAADGRNCDLKLSLADLREIGRKRDDCASHRAAGFVLHCDGIGLTADAGRVI